MFPEGNLMILSNPGRLARLCALATTVVAAPVLIASSAGAVPPLGPCSVSQSGSTITLTANCVTSATISVADGVTVDGDGFAITAVDPSGGNFSGPVLKSATGTPTTPTTMNVKNLDVVASLAPSITTISLSGLYFENAGGSITGVSVSGVTTSSTSGSGRAVEVRNAGATTAPTLAIDGLRIRNYNKSGVFIQGKTTYSATNMDIGPATGVDGAQWVTEASNSFTVVGGVNGGPSGSVTASKIAGNRYETDDAHDGPPESIAAAILSIDSPSLVVSGVTVSGVDSDNALIAQNDDLATPSHVKITCSTLTRTAGGHADPVYGQAISNDGGDGVVTMTAGSNTFSGWVLNVEGPVTSTVDPACTPAKKATVTAEAKKDEVRAGHKIKITGTASPALAGVSLSLQRKVDGEFKTVTTGTLSASGAFKLVTTAKKFMRQDHSTKFRVVVGTGTLYAGGTSSVVKVHVV
jgi:hypothetical protein